ncbi:kinase-like domain-containing protein [Syncephalis fuscata]|nr:kinase-like domain-containing protein [Syncephalis fuscata]
MLLLSRLFLAYGLILAVNSINCVEATVPYKYHRKDRILLERRSVEPILPKDLRLMLTEKLAGTKSNDLYTAKGLYATDKPAFLKCIKDKNLFETEIKAFTALNALKNKLTPKNALMANHVVELYEKFETENGYKCMVLSSFRKSVDLYNHLRIMDTAKVRQLKSIFFQILSGKLLRGVAFMHEAHVAHRDLKLEIDIIVNAEPIQAEVIEIKVIDFDNSIVFTGDEKRSAICMVGLCPPEFYNPTAPMEMRLLDSWGLGSSLYRVFMQIPPYGIDKQRMVMTLWPADKLKERMLYVYNNKKHTCTPLDILKWAENDIEKEALAMFPQLLSDLLAISLERRKAPKDLLDSLAPISQSSI